MSVIIVRVGEKTLKNILTGSGNYRDFQETGPREQIHEVLLNQDVS